MGVKCLASKTRDTFFIQYNGLTPTVRGYANNRYKQKTVTLKCRISINVDPSVRDFLYSKATHTL